MTVDPAGLTHRSKILFSNLEHEFRRNAETAVNSWNLQIADQLRMVFQKFMRSTGVGWLSDPVGHIDRKKVARVDEFIHAFEIDVVRVDVVRFIPPETSHRLVGRGARARGTGADNRMFTVGFVP